MGRGFDDGFAEFVTQWSPALLRVAFLLTAHEVPADIYVGACEGN